MSTVTTSSSVGILRGPLAAIETDLLTIPWFEEDAATFEALDEATSGEVGRALSSREFQAKPYELFLSPVSHAGWRSKRIMLIGGGRRGAADGELLRKLASTAAHVARQRRFARATFVLRGSGDAVELAQAIAEGVALAEFFGGSYKTTDPAPAAAASWTIAAVDAAADVARLNAAAHRGRVLGESTNLARELANEPGNTLTPREFATRAAAIATSGGAHAEILDERQIADLGMGLLLGVARGSSEPPRLIVLRHDPFDSAQGRPFDSAQGRPSAAPQAPVLGLVGKGITFDTGGISIKPAENMERMKDDMSGGAAVACAMRALAILGAPIPVVGVIPTTENMPGGRAVKPGDILKSAEGKTVEVINTDAEGRLILGDGLWYARRLGATHLVDVATLTGAIVVALGKTTSGVFGTPESWVERVRRVANRAGDRMWAMPIFDDYREQLKSEIADFTNTGGRPAGSITAAMFLKEFSGGLPWAHLDIAGTAWADEAKPYMPKGATGVAVRTLAELGFENLND